MENNICSTDCEICKGRGRVRRDRDITDPNFGQLEYCPKADPFKIFGLRSGLRKVDYSLRWEDINDVNDIYGSVRILRKVLETKTGWVYIFGPNGLGKTHLLQTMVAESIRIFREAKYSSMANIIDDLREGYSLEYQNGESSRRLAKYFEIPVLCIDEFDRLKKTDFAEEKIQSILDMRYASAIKSESITIIGSNKDPSEFEPYIADRIHDNRFYILEMKGNSVRPNIPRDVR